MQTYNHTHTHTLSFSVINYEITVVTGDVTFAGTNARVSIQIYGEKGKTENIILESRSNNYERNFTEIFKVSKLRFLFFQSNIQPSNESRMHANTAIRWYVTVRKVSYFSALFPR